MIPRRFNFSFIFRKLNFILFHPQTQPTFITEAKAEELLTWPAVFEACEQALISVCEEKTCDSQPSAKLPPRPFVEMKRRNGTFTLVRSSTR